jgi:hypothetical protein
MMTTDSLRRIRALVYGVAVGVVLTNLALWLGG